LFPAGWVGAGPGTLDVVFAAPPPELRSRLGNDVELWMRDDLAHHARVRRACRYRPETAVYADRSHGEPDGVLIVGQGVAGRWEMAFEVAPSARGAGLGRKLAAAAASLVPDGEQLFAQVAPGNTASLRACLAAGYTPIGAEVLFVPH
jgi:GNAT superfamily N-acetyltransferase